MGSPSDLTCAEEISNEGSGKAAVETDVGVEQESAVDGSFREILEAEPIIQLIQVPGVQYSPVRGVNVCFIASGVFRVSKRRRVQRP